MSSASIAAQQRPDQRLWRDVSKWRLFFALGFAPVPPFALGLLLIMMLVGVPPREMLGLAGGVLAAAEVWSIVAGTLFLLALAWMRGALRRGDCLLLGVLLAFSLPYTVLLADVAVDWITGASPPETVAWEDIEGPSDRSVAVIVSIVLTPFGALGGWILWRLGVRPAQPQPVDVAPVFD